MVAPVPQVPVGDLAVGCHPAVDELDERFVVYATSSSTVRLTEPFAAFVGEALVRGVRPVLLTTTTARSRSVPMPTVPWSPARRVFLAGWSRRCPTVTRPTGGRRPRPSA
jgi:hypothetical protein